MPDFSKQIGIIGEYDPELCAVSGKNVRGKNANTFYKGDGKHFVRVLNAYVDKWKNAHMHYGFPESIIQEEQSTEHDVFVLEDLNDLDVPSNEVILPTGDNGLSNFTVSPSRKIVNPSKKESDS